jgi:hypothetical protein
MDQILYFNYREAANNNNEMEIKDLESFREFRKSFAVHREKNSMHREAFRGDRIQYF